MRKILLVFFFALSIAFLLAPTLQAQNDVDPGVTLLETQLQLVSSDTILITPGGDEIKPGKYNSPSDVDTKVIPDTTPTCEEIFTVIQAKQAKGETLSQFDQAMRARCIEQPIFEDDDKQDDYRPELSLAIPKKDTLSRQEGKITRIELRVNKSCCPSPEVPDCPTCGDRPGRDNPNVTRATQSGNNYQQPTHPTQPNIDRPYHSGSNSQNVTRPTRPLR